MHVVMVGGGVGRLVLGLRMVFLHHTRPDTVTVRQILTYP
jgi:hypothetical protein